jgi:LytS/YehU family sensor histidine kinase
VQKAAYGSKSPQTFEIINPIEIPVGKGIVGHVAQTGKAEIVGNTRHDNRYIIDDEIRNSEITVPIIHQEKVIGIIDSEHKQRNFFTKKHLEILQTIASISSAKISKGIVLEKMKQTEKELAALNTRMLETQFLNLRLQMNPHFLFNSLSSIQHLIVSNQTHEAYTYLTVFSHFLRSVLKYADKTFISLQEEIQMLEMYIKLESLGFDKSFNYDITIDEKLDTEDILIPPLMIQPLIENAIWHGLVNKEGDKYFSLQFHNDGDDNLVCLVEDNGIGRKKAAAINLQSLQSSIHESKATKLLKQRLELLRQKTSKEASIYFEDIYEHNLPAGTRVQVIIPYYNTIEI